jgi:apolipoprotein N-acyltransferase
LPLLPLPPWFFTPGIFSFAILGFLLSKSTGLIEAARVSWLFSFGFHLVGIHWISNAFLVDRDQFGVFVPFVIVGLPAVLALFPAVILSVFPLIRRSPSLDIVTIAILWSISDFSRGKLFTGFPWNLMSYTISFSENLSQIASVVGAYGLNFLVIFVALAPSILLSKRFYRTKSSFFILFSCCFIPLSNGIWWHAEVAKQ